MTVTSDPAPRRPRPRPQAPAPSVRRGVRPRGCASHSPAPRRSAACIPRPRSPNPRRNCAAPAAHAARGEPAWRRRLERYEQGDTLIVALTARAVIKRTTGAQHEPPWHYCHETVWVARATAPWTLTDRLRALAHRDFTTVAAALRNRGIATDASEKQIAAEFVIDPAVTAQLSAPPDDDANGPQDQS